jgi:hypothetical protein
MHTHDYTAASGERGADLDETRRRFLFAREHLAAHAPRGRHQPVLKAAARGPHGDRGSRAHRASSGPGA